MLSKETHRLLKIQFETHCNDKTLLQELLKNPHFESFILSINRAYFEYDDDKKLLENIVKENQKELVKVNEELKELNLDLENRVVSKTQNLQSAFQELAIKEKRIRSIIESIAEIILIVDENLNIKFVSENLFDQRKFSVESLINKNLSSFLNTKQLKEFKAILEKRNTSNNIFQFSFPNLESTFTKFEANITLNTEGSDIEYVITLRDVTEIRKIQTEIKKQKEFYENILANIPADLAIFDVDHRYIFLNNKAIQDPELRKLIIGKTDYEYGEIRGHSREKPDSRRQLFLKAISEKKTIPFEEKGMDKQGNPQYVLRQFTPIFNANNELENMIGLGVDITGRILAEQKIEELNQNLEEMVLKRTNQLELAIKELDAFSYSVSHDLRSPLRAVDGWSLALLEDFGESLDPQAIEYIKRVRIESQRMALLIDDLLNLSKIGKIQLKIKKIDFSAFCQKIFDRELETTDRNDFQLVIDKELFIEADENLLDIMMTNLITNAIKFSSKVEKPKITIGKILNEEKSNLFFIKDNGAGFNSELTKKLFGAFQRMHKQSDFPGTGIGLATVKRIVELHSGKIWAESQVNEGALFKFKIS
jgi:PAS domain S-box-containing protein